MVRLLKISSILIVVLLFFIWFLLEFDTQKNAYTNKNEVLNDKAIVRGWVPRILPDSAYEIQEKHNIDTNQINGSFKYLEKDEKIFLSNLTTKDNIYIWENYKFEVDTKINEVKFSSKNHGLL